MKYKITVSGSGKEKVKLKQDIKLRNFVIERGSIVTIEPYNNKFKLTTITDDTVIVPKNIKYEQV